MGPTLAIVSAVSAVSSIAGGMSKMGAANREAASIDQQAQIALQQSQQSARQKALEVEQFAQSQQMTYAKSGVTLQGSPALVIERTRQQGAQEVNALLRQGQAQSSLMQMQAKNQRSAGRAALIGGIGSAATSVLGNYTLGQKIGLYGNPVGATAATVSPLSLPGSSGYA